MFGLRRLKGSGSEDDKAFCIRGFRSGIGACCCQEEVREGEYVPFGGLA